jgi:hypothetical protein
MRLKFSPYFVAAVILVQLLPSGLAFSQAKPAAPAITVYKTPT